MEKAMIKLDVWINDGERDEIRTIGTFGWVWCELGGTLRAGPGPAFGNADPAGVVVAQRYEDGLWYLLGEFEPKKTPNGFTDYDVQVVS